MNEQEKYDWMVFVSCMTYNHAPYIVDAMNGFTMQETNFPFVCAVVDDASTDGEPEVIRKYLLENFDLEDKSVVRHEETDDYVLTFARHKTNLNCYFAVFYLKYNHYRKKAKAPYLAQWREKAKYIAICEGDDYWIHPSKLSKQVSYLEDHSNCGLTVSHAKFLNHEKQSLFKIEGKVKTKFRSILLSGGIGTATCTIVYRREIYKGYSELVKGQKWLMGDLPLLLYTSLYTDIYCFDDYFVTYRILQESASHSRSYVKSVRFINSVLEIQLFFANLYEPNLIDAIKQNHIRRLFINATTFSQTEEVQKYFADINRHSFKDYIRLYIYYINRFLKNAKS